MKCIKNKLSILLLALVALVNVTSAMERASKRARGGDEGAAGAAASGQGSSVLEIETLIQAAERGDARAQTKLGLHYLHGYRVEKNEQEAVRLFRAAAGNREVGAQLVLGFCYLMGRGVEANRNEAKRFYKLAAENGYLPAISCYEVIEARDRWERIQDFQAIAADDSVIAYAAGQAAYDELMRIRGEQGRAAQPDPGAAGAGGSR